MSNTGRRVVITGYGSVTPLGMNASACWKSIIEKRLGFKYIDKSPLNIKTRFIGVIDKEPDLSFLPIALRRRLPRFAKLSLSAAHEAIISAFGNSLPSYFYDPYDCGVIMGSGWAGQDETCVLSEEYQRESLASPFSCFFGMLNIASAACSQYWQLKGYQNTVSAACATGTIAVGDAYEIIKNGKARMMLAGAGESLRTDFSVWSIDVLGALSSERYDINKASCPFSADRNGFVLSEGAAVLCLEDMEYAMERKANILGEIKGYANFSDSYDLTTPENDCCTKVKTILKTLENADLEPKDIDYINAHGTSTYLNDISETKALKMAFGKKIYDIPISSTKSYSGHLISAAGSFESIICLKALENNLLPSTLNLAERDPLCDLDYISEGHRIKKSDTALNVNFGFGGANAAIIFKKI
ncbi:beta-ketoacyl-[acyl-carrier-protein] synthase family protein, partial [Salmonella enterica]|nr:beta-ketoacyl-[acyl-carrier-protein] synthase family protein [Salmonella enterica]